jgi:hypothetical protein
VEPGSVHDITAARAVPRRRGRAVHLADPGYEGAGIGVHIPVKQPAGRRDPGINTRTRHAVLRSLRCLGERGFALLTGRWRTLQHITASPAKSMTLPAPPLPALIASFCTATSSVCQRLGAIRDQAEGFDLRLARRPAWLLGLASMIAGFAFQISALHSGPLALVQPILALELLFVFAYMAILGSLRITVRPRDRLAAVAMSPGSAPFSAWPHLREGGRTHQVAGGIRFGANGEAVGLRIRSSGDPPRYETSRLSSQTANFRPLS